MFTKQRNILIVVGSVISALMVYYAGCLNGPGLTYDSVNYLFAGYSFYRTGEFVRPYGNPFIEWPPLYPFIISGLSILPAKLFKSVFYFHLLVTALTIGLSGKLAQVVIHNKLLFVFCLISLVFSTPLLLINHFVWSESFFVFLTVCYTWSLIRYTKEGHSLHWFILVVLSMLLCLSCYVGVFYVLAGMVIIFLYARRNAFWFATSYGAMATLPLILWFIRNIMLTGYIWNETENFNASISEYLITFNHVITNWFLPNELNINVRLFIFLGF